MTREALLSETFVHLADALVDDFDVLDVLTLLADRSVELLDASQAGILLTDQTGHLQLVAATSAPTRLLELFQLQNHEGPCLDCFRNGTVVAVDDLETTAQWPRFRTEALACGFRAVHAFPLRLRDRFLGALNLFVDQPQRLDDPDMVVAQALADAATIALLQNEAFCDARRLAGELQLALDSRIVLEQAKGVLAERAAITVDEAFARLRNHARSHNLTLRTVARDVVSGDLEPAPVVVRTQSAAAGSVSHWRDHG